MSTTKPVLQEAHEIIYGDREQTYGSPEKNLTVIATYWETYLSSRGLWNDDAAGLEITDVCYMMALLKLARFGNNPEHHDSLVDACGYIALADRVLNLDV